MSVRAIPAGNAIPKTEPPVIYYLAQLSALCRQYPVQPKVVFVPSAQVGYHLTTALAASGQAWANLHLTSPADWVRQRVAPRLQAEGWTPLLPNYPLFFMGPLIEDALAQARYFSNTATRDELTRTFLSTFVELRLAGVRPEDLAAESEDKLREIAAGYRAYIDALHAQRYYDEALLFQRALEEMDRAPGQAGSVYALFDETQLGALATQYISALAGDALFRIGASGYSRPAPAQSAAVRFAQRSLPETNATADVGSGGHLLAGRGDDRDRVRVRTVQVLGAEEEVRFVFRDILAQERPLDEVEIAYTTDAPYLALLHGLSERFDVPLSFASGLPPERTRPGQALLGFVRWIASGFDAAELAGLCRARLIHFSRSEGDEEDRVPWAFEVAALLDRGRVQRGRRDYADGLKRLRYELAQQIRENEGQGRDTGRLQAQMDLLDATRQTLNALFDLLPSGSTIELAGLTEACSLFLADYAPVESGYDGDAVTSLTVHLRMIGEQVHAKGSLPSLAGTLLELLNQHRIEAASAIPGHAFAVPLERAGYTHRQHLYILGMDEGSFPGRGIEDPVLLDDERRQLGLDVPLHRTRPGERVWQAERALMMAPGTATLLARRSSLESGSEFFPSAFFQQVEKAVLNGAEADPPRPFLPPTSAESLDRSELMLTSRTRAGYASAVEQAAPWLVAGRYAHQQRQLPGFTRFDGCLEQATPELNPGNGRILLSASRLEALVRCPYSYFLKYVLHVDVPERREEEDAMAWLNPLDFGSLLHDLLCDFMQELTDGNELPTARHIPALQELARERIEAQKDVTPVTHEAAYRADVERLEQAVEIFLNVEERQQNTEPAGFEVSFGFGQSGALDSAEPIVVRLTEAVSLRLRGRMDRVDRVEGGYAIWDYKSGSAYGYGASELSRAGSYLQWALYAYVLDEILGAKGLSERVVQSGYFFTTAREYGKRVGPPLLARHELGDLLQPLFQLVADGHFLHVQKKAQGDHCAYCEFHRLCAGESVTPSKWKKVGPDVASQSAAAGAVSRWLDD
jgi:RecB family exonuclease